MIIIKGYSKKHKHDSSHVGDDNYEQQYEYEYKYKAIAYDNDEASSPTHIYTNHAGNVVVVGDKLGNVLRSTNYGKSWDQSKSLYDGDSYLYIAGLVMNEAGDEMIVSTNTDTIFYSSDYGKTFSIRSSDRQCSIMASSIDLKTIVCIGGQVATIDTSTGDDDDDDNVDDDGIDSVNLNYLYYSQDSGYTWHQSNSKHARWIGLLSNEDGSWIVGVIRHKLQYAWASSDGGITYTNINDEEINNWGVLCGSKDLTTMMMTDTSSRNVHISEDYGYTWTQIYNGEDNDESVTLNSCAVAADSYEDSDTDIELAIGFSGTSMKVVYGCDPHTETAHCADRWYDTGSSDSSAATYSVALSKDGKYFYSIDASTMKVSIGHRESI